LLAAVVAVALLNMEKGLAAGEMVAVLGRAVCNRQQMGQLIQGVVVVVAVIQLHQVQVGQDTVALHGGRKYEHVKPISDT
jgi:ABC-type taurine transport system ATPase subunit